MGRWQLIRLGFGAVFNQQGAELFFRQIQADTEVIFEFQTLRGAQVKAQRIALVSGKVTDQILGVGQFQAIASKLLGIFHLQPFDHHRLRGTGCNISTDIDKRCQSQAIVAALNVITGGNGQLICRFSVAQHRTVKGIHAVR